MVTITSERPVTQQRYRRESLRTRGDRRATTMRTRPLTDFTGIETATASGQAKNLIHHARRQLSRCVRRGAPEVRPRCSPVPAR